MKKTKYVRESFRLYLPPAVGYRFPHLQGMLRKYGVEKGYHGRAFIISAISAIGVFCRIYERKVYDNKASQVQLEEPPVFILGHWRSGTTHLHNLLCKDPAASYVSTYQSVFPDQTLASGTRFVFKNIMKMIMPLNRKGDNVKLNTEYPQEEEFALAARNPGSFYYFWYFPRLIREYYDEFLTFEKNSDEVRLRFIQDYKRVINKAILNTGTTRFLSKNPPNTARIPILLEMYPDARFIHIYRNPVDVVLSTRHFFSKMMPGLTLHHIDYDEVNNNIYHIYDKMMKDYLETRSLIPQDKLIEVKYEDLIADSETEIQNIYQGFNFAGYEHAAPLIKAYADSKKGYVKNKYSIKRDLLNEILDKTSFAMKEWGYDVPDNLEILDA